MGVSTKAIIRKSTTLEQIINVLSELENISDVEVYDTSSHATFFQIGFRNDGEFRLLSIDFSNHCETIYGIGGVWMSLGYGLSSIVILKRLCEIFGGYIDENDCDDKPFYSINFELYSQGAEFSEMDLLKHKIIAKCGYNKLNDIIKLFNEFKNIN